MMDEMENDFSSIISLKDTNWVKEMLQHNSPTIYYMTETVEQA